MFSFSRILSFCYILLLSLSTIYARPNPQVPTRRRTAARGILSPILGVTEKTFDQQVKDTIQQDVQATIDQFKNVPESIQKIIQQAIRLPLSQQIYNLNSTEQLNNLATQIKSNLNQVQQDVISDIGQLRTGVMDDTDNLQALQTCITAIVAQGGLREGENCLSESGYSISSLAEQFNTFVQVNDFDLPAKAINDATQSVLDYLDTVDLYPGAEALIEQTQKAIQNVVLTQAASNRDAALRSFQCFTTAIQVISTQPLQDRYLQCDLGNTGTAFDQSTLAAVENSYIAATNQYSGYLPPNIVSDIQAIGLKALSVSTDPYAAAVRSAINDAILSRVAATTPTAATLAITLTTCLNTLLDLNADNNCDVEKNVEVARLNDNIMRNAVAQFISILPLRLVAALRDNIPTLAGNYMLSEEEVAKRVQQLQELADAGPRYADCYGAFSDCLLNNLQTSTPATCTKGDACTSLPVLSVDPTDPTSPYAAILSPNTPTTTTQSGRQRRSLLPRKPRKVLRVYQMARS